MRILASCLQNRGRRHLKRGGIITGFDGQPVRSEHQLPEMVAQAPIGNTVPVEVVRNGKPLTLSATIP